jgi:hypothetical protein
MRRFCDQGHSAAAMMRVHNGQEHLAMRDFLRDWKRWSPAERIVAVLVLATIVLVQIPLVL